MQMCLSYYPRRNFAGRNRIVGDISLNYCTSRNLFRSYRTIGDVVRADVAR
jgi:hypothetical protein